MNNSLVIAGESIVKEIDMNYPVELSQSVNNSVVNVRESIVEETSVNYPVELSLPVYNSVVNVKESIVEEIGINYPDGTKFLTNNVDSPIPRVHFTTRDENWDALAVMSLSPEVLEGKQETPRVGDTVDSFSATEAVTPDDPIVDLKEKNIVPSNHCDFLSAEVPKETSIQSHCFSEESTKPAQGVIETISMKLETVETSSPYCLSDCALTCGEKAFALVSANTEPGFCSPQPDELQLKREQVTAKEQKSTELFTEATKLFSCDSCDLKFVKITNLFRHTSAHTKSPVLCCDDCDLTFVSVVELLSHNVAVHDCSNDFMCNLCEMKVASCPELIEHVGRHDNREPFQCSECSLLFWGYSEYCRHCQGHTQEILSECVVCQYVFRNESDLHDHQKFLHSIIEKAELSSDNEFMCEACGELFSDLKALNEHGMDAHERPSLFRCGTCGKSFPTSRGLAIHQRRIHSKPLKSPLKQRAKSMFECGVCWKKFYNMSVYSRHISTHKTRSRQSSLNAKFKIKVSSLSFSEKDFVCEICNALFSQAAELRWHIQDSHYCEVRRKNGR